MVHMPPGKCFKHNPPWSWQLKMSKYKIIWFTLKTQWHRQRNVNKHHRISLVLLVRLVWTEAERLLLLLQRSCKYLRLSVDEFKWRFQKYSEVLESNLFKMAADLTELKLRPYHEYHQNNSLSLKLVKGSRWCLFLKTFSSDRWVPIKTDVFGNNKRK